MSINTEEAGEQEESLNRAISEYEGWWFDGETKKWCLDSGHSFHTSDSFPVYTRDLNAIVDVINKSEWEYTIISQHLTESVVVSVGLEEIEVENTKTALALSLAFAQAAGLEWEKK